MGQRARFLSHRVGLVSLLISIEDFRALTGKAKNIGKREACVLCGRHAVEPTREHLQPLSRGGKKSGSNCKPACRACNQIKGNMTLAEFRYFIKTGTFHKNYIEHMEQNRTSRLDRHLKKAFNEHLGDLG